MKYPLGDKPFEPFVTQIIAEQLCRALQYYVEVSSDDAAMTNWSGLFPQNLLNIISDSDCLLIDLFVSFPVAIPILRR
jgi:hypothetical protein